MKAKMKATTAETFMVEYNPSLERWVIGAHTVGRPTEYSNVTYPTAREAAERLLEILQRI